MMTKHDIRVAQGRISIVYSVLIVMTVLCGVHLPFQMTVPVATAQDSKPKAVIDGDSKVSVRKTVYLSGTFSSDPGGLGLNYQWTLVSSPEGSLATMVDSGTAQPSFEADVAGTYRVILVVNNGFVDSAPAYWIVTVTKEGTAEDPCSEGGITVRNATMLDLWYRKSAGECSIWTHEHRFTITPGDSIEIFSDKNCQTLYCTNSPAYKDYQSVDTNGDCFVNIFPNCSISDK